jgi:lipopolysaccharide heptosyltransferase II
MARNTQSRKILIITPNWLGDILFTTPSIRAIRKSNPGAFIGVMAHPRCRPLLEFNRDIDELILFDERSCHKGLLARIFFILALRKSRFDMVVSFHRSMSRMLIAYLAGIPRRVGYYTRKRSWLLTDYAKEKNIMAHRVEYFLDLLKTIGIDPAGQDYEFNALEADRIAADAILKNVGISGNEDFFIINPGGNWLQKRWPKQNYSNLCQRLHDIYKCKILITGAEKDIDLASDIIAAGGRYIINICGQTTLRQLAAIMRKASAVIANDSGPMHIAISQNVPTIALFGPTSPRITGPNGSGKYIVLHKWFNCQIPCYKTCHDHACMEAISVEDVLWAVKEISHTGNNPDIGKDA